VVTSFVQRLPAAVSQYRRYLPLFPAAVRRFDLSGYDLVLSLSHCVAKGVRTPPGALHLCYCFMPMRYVWDLADDYVGARAGLYARCGAVLFPAVEDFGIVPLEAAAAGRPTIALGCGGVLETMIGLGADHAAPTAVFFGEPTVEALADAIHAFETAEDRFDP